MQNPVEIPLKHPFEYGGETVSEVTMMVPRVHHSLSADGEGDSAASKEIALFASLCEIEAACLHQMHMGDYGKLQETYQDFLS